jgi:hypothetical protein
MHFSKCGGLLYRTIATASLNLGLFLEPDSEGEAPMSSSSTECSSAEAIHYMTMMTTARLVENRQEHEEAHVSLPHFFFCCCFFFFCKLMHACIEWGSPILTDRLCLRGFHWIATFRMHDDMDTITITKEKETETERQRHEKEPERDPMCK